MAQNVTQMLKNWQDSTDPQSRKELSPVLYETMKRLSSKYIQQEQHGYTLQATDLVHEAYVRLVDSEIDWQSRRHFYAVAASTMRRILIDRAREKNAQKRGQNANRITFIESNVENPQQWEDIFHMDEAIEQLSQQDKRKADIIQLHYFAGLTYQELALCMDISEATVERELRFSKAWLASRMEPL